MSSDKHDSLWDAELETGERVLIRGAELQTGERVLIRDAKLETGERVLIRDAELQTGERVLTLPHIGGGLRPPPYFLIVNNVSHITFYTPGFFYFVDQSILRIL